ncbi:MAG: hypothetical protein K2X39_04195, partial [Silvanigrellaceae bacterium]|nr:hypothetical protein [Silvanigrellaceae bacterium]
MKFFFFIVLLFFPLHLFALQENLKNTFSHFKETLGVSGSLRSAYWSKDKSYSDARNFWVESGWLTLRPKEFHGFKTFFEGYLQAENLSRTGKLHSDLREAYLETSIGLFD